MKILIAGATGFIGRHLVQALLSDDHQIVVIGRSASHITKTLGPLVHAIEWSALDTINPDEYQAVINLAGRSVSAWRWTSSIKKTILSSRVSTTEKIAAWCGRANNKPHLYNASAIGIYGLQPTTDALPRRLTERDQPPATPCDFLSEVGIAWENATQSAREAGVPVTFLRFGVVLKRGEGVLGMMAIPFQFGLGSRMGSGKQPFSWVYITDVVSAIQFLLQHPAIVGPVNIVAPECVTQDQFATTLAKIMHRPYFLRTPDWLLKTMLGQMADELVLNGQHVYPARLLQEQFVFRFPTLDKTLTMEW